MFPGNTSRSAEFSGLAQLLKFPLQRFPIDLIRFAFVRFFFKQSTDHSHRLIAYCLLDCRPLGCGTVGMLGKPLHKFPKQLWSSQLMQQKINLIAGGSVAKSK